MLVPFAILLTRSARPLERQDLVLLGELISPGIFIAPICLGIGRKTGGLAAILSGFSLGAGLFVAGGRLLASRAGFEGSAAIWMDRYFSRFQAASAAQSSAGQIVGKTEPYRLPLANS